MSKLISVISGNRFLQDGRLCKSSSVKTDWNCLHNTLAFAQSDVAGKTELVLRVGMPVSSPCKALIYDQKDLGLSFRSAATISDIFYLNNYRPVSNLCFIAKILEKLVLSQDSSYLNSHNLYNTCQSAYRPGHSTETALLKVVNDLFLSLNKGNISVLALFDFSSAFDTIDHPILAHRLHTDFGFTDTVLQWFLSYLTDRTHYVALSNHCSAFTHVHSGVPQGSVLGPILLTMYIKPLSAIFDSHSIIHHSFADDLQLQMSAPQIEYLSYFTPCSHV